MTVFYSADVVIAACLPTVQKFCFIVNRMGVNATAIYNTVAGLTPQSGMDYGRYYERTDLPAYAAASGSVADLINEGIELRQTLISALQNAVIVAATEDISVDLYPALQAAISALLGCCATAADQINLMLDLIGFTPPPILVGADTIGGEVASVAAMTAAMIRILALHALAGATAIYEPTSQQDAITLRNTVADALQAEMLTVSAWFDDADFAALNQDRLAVVEDLNARGSTLQPVITVTETMNRPASVIAYMLYQDASRADDLITRNDPINPLSMPLVIEALAE